MLEFFGSMPDPEFGQVIKHQAVEKESNGSRRTVTETTAHV